MPKLFELFGFPLDVHTPEAQQHRLAARCPFMGCDCDGGGNRYLSNINLNLKPELKAIWPNRDEIVSGVCSIRLNEVEQPWIVCPRRLLVLGKRSGQLQRASQTAVEQKLLTAIDFPIGTTVVWPEVKLKSNSPEQLNEDEEEDERTFDYTFDYVIMPLDTVNQHDIVRDLGGSWAAWRKVLLASGYALSRKDGIEYVDDFPVDAPYIIEIMTSSTSGGNKNKRTTIPQSFEDAILGKYHMAPGINKRQVWARMVSQLIVKSQTAIAWGGKTLWVVQDNLAEYIQASTALNLKAFVSDELSEVNLLSFNYGDYTPTGTGLIELCAKQQYAGPISPTLAQNEPSFTDIIKTAFVPSRYALIKALTKCHWSTKIQV